MRTEELLHQTRELENIEIPLHEMEEPNKDNSEFINLINRLKNKEIPLSKTSLQKFLESPRNFIMNKLEPKTSNIGMDFGKLCECLIIQPENFDKEFVISDLKVTSENQIGFLNDLLKGIDKDEAFKNNYKVGSVDKLQHIIDYAELLHSGKSIVSQEDRDLAEKIKENLLKNDTICDLLSEANNYQVKHEFSLNGYKIIGYTDCEGEDIILDLKYTKDANPEKFNRDFMNFGYDFQAGVYTYDNLKKYYVIAFDKSLNYSIIEVDMSLKQYGKDKLNYCLRKMDECIENNSWMESYNFHSTNPKTRIITFSKPKWAKSYNTDGIL